MNDLDSLRLPNPEMALWFRETLQTQLGDMFAHHQRHLATLKKRPSEVAAMSDRLLNTYLAGTIDEPTINAKSAELKGETLRIEESLQKVRQVDDERSPRAGPLIFSHCPRTPSIPQAAS